MLIDRVTPVHTLNCSVDALTFYARTPGGLNNESTLGIVRRGEPRVPLSQTGRSVVLFKMHVEMVPAEASEDLKIGLPGAVQMIVDAFHAKRAHMRVGEYAEDEADTEDTANQHRERPNILSIEDVDWEQDGTITLLLHHGDKGATDPALKNIDTGEIRAAGKTDKEALAHAAHLMVSTETHVTATGQGRALVERVPNIGRTTIVTLLNTILRQEAALVGLEYVHKETRRKRRCHPRIVSHFQMSRTLRADLEGGKLHSVEFITRKIVDCFEQDNITIPLNKTLALKVVKPPLGERLFGLIGDLKSWGRDNGFEDMQLNFTKKETKQVISPRMSTELEDAEDALYSRAEPIEGFSAPLGPVEIHLELISAEPR